MEQTEKTAEEFLKKVYGNHAGCFRLSEKLCNTDSHVYRYTAYQNDIPIAGSYAVIRVNSFNDTVYNFNGCQQEFFSLEYPEPIGVIEPEEDVYKRQRLYCYRIVTTYLNTAYIYSFCNFSFDITHKYILHYISLSTSFTAINNPKPITSAKPIKLIKMCIRDSNISVFHRIPHQFLC